MTYLKETNSSFSQGMVANMSPLKSYKGFTLIEILVVMVIISIIVALAVLTVGGGLQQRELSSSAEQVHILMQSASEQAILLPKTIGFGLKEDGYAFYAYDSANNTWQRLDQDRLLKPQTINNDLLFTIKIAKAFYNSKDSKTPQNPTIVFYPDGTVTPFQLSIAEVDGPVEYIISTNNQHKINLQRVIE